MNLRKDHSHMFQQYITVNCSVVNRVEAVWSFMLLITGGGVNVSFPLLLCLQGALVPFTEFCSLQLLFTIFSDGCLGSNNDEGRSEVR